MYIYLYTPWGVLTAGQPPCCARVFVERQKALAVHYYYIIIVIIKIAIIIPPLVFEERQKALALHYDYYYDCYYY
jgi:hypothetical protein